MVACAQESSAGRICLRAFASFWGLARGVPQLATFHSERSRTRDDKSVTREQLRALSRHLSSPAPLNRAAGC